MKVILYKRVSTDEQADKGFSLGFQDDMLNDFCKKNSHTIIGNYFDDASGKDFNRPEYKKMKKWISENKSEVDMVLVTRWDRFGRNVELCLKEKRELTELGVQVNAISQWLESKKNESNIVMLSLYLSIGENVRENIISNTTRGTNEAKRQGYFTGKAPYGFMNIRDLHGKPTLKIIEEKAKFVRHAFEEVALGMDSVEFIFKKYKKLGLAISKNTFYRMFHNPTYCGRIHVTAWLDKPEEIVEGKHEGIVSVATFVKAQANKMNNRWKGIVPKSEDSQFPLRNYLTCPICGKNLTGSPSKGRNKKYYYYHCRQSCSTRVQAPLVHSYFISFLERISIKKEFKDLILETLEQTIIQFEGNSQQELKRLRYELKCSREQLMKLDQQLMDNKIPIERYNRMSDTLEKKIAQIEVDIMDLEDRKKPKKENLQKTLWIMSNLSEVYESADYKGKRKLLATLFPEKIILEKDKCRTTKNNEVLALIASISASFEQKKSGTIGENSKLYRFVLEAGLEPARPYRHRILSPACLPIPPFEQTLKKYVISTALDKRYFFERETRFELATPTLARLCSTN
jgi:site-specific DNA recombinase